MSKINEDYDEGKNSGRIYSNSVRKENTLHSKELSGKKKEKKEKSEVQDQTSEAERL